MRLYFLMQIYRYLLTEKNVGILYGIYFQQKTDFQSNFFRISKYSRRQFFKNTSRIQGDTSRE